MTNQSSHIIGIADAEVDLSKVDESLITDSYPRATWIQCGLCTFCKTTENMPLDCAPGSACFLRPGELPLRLVHCQSPKCIACAQLTFNKFLADRRHFFVNQNTANTLFSVKTVKVPRTGGTVSEGKINLSVPFVLDRDDKISIFCEIDNETHYKAVTLENLIKYNFELRNQWLQAKNKFQVLHQQLLKLNYPALLTGIEKSVLAIDQRIKTSI